MSDKGSLKLILASASKARAKVLKDAHICFTQISSKRVDEDDIIRQNQSLENVEILKILSGAKAYEVATEVRGAETYVIGCDSMFEFDGSLVGKPKNKEHAKELILSYCGRSGDLHTAHTVYYCDGKGKVRPVGEDVATTKIYFSEFTGDEVEQYVESGEPLNVAGAFAIDSRGSAFIEKIEGDYHSVVGISPNVVRKILKGRVEITKFWEDKQKRAM